MPRFDHSSFTGPSADASAPAVPASNPFSAFNAADRDDREAMIDKAILANGLGRDDRNFVSRGVNMAVEDSSQNDPTALSQVVDATAREAARLKAQGVGFTDRKGEVESFAWNEAQRYTGRLALAGV